MRKKLDLLFHGYFTLSLLLLVGVLLKAVIYLQLDSPDVSEFFVNILDVVSSGCITAGFLDVVLHFSSEKQLFDKILSHIDRKADEIKEEIASISGCHSNTLDIEEVIRSFSKNTLENVSLTEQEIKSDLGLLAENIQCFSDSFTKNPVYYHSYSRKVTLHPTNKKKIISVETSTTIQLINLSSIPYSQDFDPQFRINTGAGKTYRIEKVIYNGNDLTQNAKEVSKASLVKCYEHGQYEEGKKYTISIPPHSAGQIKITSVYETPLSMFYQAKVLILPCVHFDLSAGLSDEFVKEYSKHHIFRWTVFQNNPQKPTARNLGGDNIVEKNNAILHISGVKYLKPGNGYSLALSSMEPPSEK